jgi:hypothetical protein
VYICGRTKGPLPLHTNRREINASWTTGDDRKHVNCTRDLVFDDGRVATCHTCHVVEMDSSRESRQ